MSLSVWEGFEGAWRHLEACEMLGLSDKTFLGHVTWQFLLILLGMCRSTSKLSVHMLNSVIKGLDGRNPCRVVDERTGRNSGGVTTAKETKKRQWTFIEG
jgi:hypothetical protein